MELDLKELADKIAEKIKLESPEDPYVIELFPNPDLDTEVDCFWNWYKDDSWKIRIKIHSVEVYDINSECVYNLPDKYFPELEGLIEN